MSYYKSSKYILPILPFITKHSVSLLKNHGYKVHFLGNDEAIEEFKDIKWDYVDNSLNNLNKDYKYTWSFSKLEAFKKCCELYENFYHIDQDVFIFNPLELENINHNIIVQSREGSDRYYKMPLLKKHCSFLPSIFNIETPSTFYNMGFFGGKSSSLLPVVKDCLEFIYHPENINFFTKKEHFDGICQAILAEQGFFGYYVKSKNIPIYCIQEHLKGYYHHGFHKIMTDTENYSTTENIKSFLEKIYKN